MFASVTYCRHGSVDHVLPGFAIITFLAITLYLLTYTAALSGGREKRNTIVLHLKRLYGETHLSHCRIYRSRIPGSVFAFGQITKMCSCNSKSAFIVIYRTMLSDKMMTLRSGAIVEELFFAQCKMSDRSHLIHSVVLNPFGKSQQGLFIPQDWDEITMCAHEARTGNTLRPPLHACLWCPMMLVIALMSCRYQY